MHSIPLVSECAELYSCELWALQWNAWKTNISCYCIFNDVFSWKLENLCIICYPFSWLTLGTAGKGWLFRGTKIDANSRNSVPNDSAEENTTRNSFPWKKKIEINSQNAVWTIPWKRNQHHFVKLFCCCFVKLIFSAEFHSVLFRSELRNWLFRGTRNASDWVLSSKE